MGEFSENVIIRKGLMTVPSDHNLHANHTVPTFKSSHRTGIQQASGSSPCKINTFSID